METKIKQIETSNNWATSFTSTLYDAGECFLQSINIEIPITYFLTRNKMAALWGGAGHFIACTSKKIFFEVIDKQNYSSETKEVIKFAGETASGSLKYGIKYYTSKSGEEFGFKILEGAANLGGYNLFAPYGILGAIPVEIVSGFIGDKLSADSIDSTKSIVSAASPTNIGINAVVGILVAGGILWHKKISETEKYAAEYICSLINGDEAFLSGEDNPKAEL